MSLCVEATCYEAICPLSLHVPTALCLIVCSGPSCRLQVYTSYHINTTTDAAANSDSYPYYYNADLWWDVVHKGKVRQSINQHRRCERWPMSYCHLYRSFTRSIPQLNVSTLLLKTTTTNTTTAAAAVKTDYNNNIYYHYYHTTSISSSSAAFSLQNVLLYQKLDKTNK